MKSNFRDEYAGYMPTGEPAKNFAPYVLVWSEMAVRAAIHRALIATARRKNKDLSDKYKRLALYLRNNHGMTAEDIDTIGKHYTGEDEPDNE
ncbi:MAG: hypothetical protein NUV49_02535 [Patescibacteria group bacterium]|nr:hypothetical protein [Patescibacteria group bacterium]